MLDGCVRTIHNHKPQKFPIRHAFGTRSMFGLNKTRAATRRISSSSAARASILVIGSLRSSREKKEKTKQCGQPHIQMCYGGNTSTKRNHEDKVFYSLGIHLRISSAGLVERIFQRQSQIKLGVLFKTEQLQVADRTHRCALRRRICAICRPVFQLELIELLFNYIYEMILTYS